MAKKEGTKAPDKGEPPGRLKGAFRMDAMKALGESATDEQIADKMNAGLAEAGYSWRVTADYVRSKREGPKQPRQNRSGPSHEKTEPTLSDLFTVREAGAAVDLETITTVAKLAEKVGGLDNLRRCLEALERLKG